MKKLPQVIALNEFMEGKGDMLSNTTGLCELPKKKFLRNRIELAFLAGWRAAQDRITKPVAPGPKLGEI